MVIKITNCTTTTGGSKVPLRLRHNQNVIISISENSNPYSWSEPNIMFMANGRKYCTSYESKTIILKQ